jgi:hypothetical protein
MNPHLTDAIARLAAAQNGGGHGSEATATLIVAQAILAVATELKLTRETP